VDSESVGDGDNLDTGEDTKDCDKGVATVESGGGTIGFTVTDDSGLFLV